MINSRLDNALDYMNKYNIKVGNDAFKKYIDFFDKNEYNIQKTIEEIEQEGCIYTCDLNDVVNNLFNNNDKEDVELGICPIDIEYIKYKGTHVYNSPDEEVIDIYEIKYMDGNIIEIASDQLLELHETGAVVTDDGVFALDEESLMGYIDNV